MLLTVVTPTYNRRDDLIKCMESVKRECTNLDAEHIIVDNLSSDGTREAVSRYASKVPYPVVFISEPDKGIYDAMNKGIRRARGTWIHILNSDDEYAAGSRIGELLTASLDDVDIIACGIAVPRTNCPDRIWLPVYYERLRHHKYPHPGLIIKRAFYNENGMYSTKYRIISDALYASEHFDNARISIQERILVRMDSGGISNIPSARNYREQIIMLLWHHRFPWYNKTIRFLKLCKKIIKQYTHRRFRRFIRKNDA